VRAQSDRAGEIRGAADDQRLADMQAFLIREARIKSYSRHAGAAVIWISNLSVSKDADSLDDDIVVSDHFPPPTHFLDHELLEFSRRFVDHD